MLYLGRLKRYKRIELLLDALEATPDAVLDVAGEGDHREELEREIESRALADRVRMHGHVSEERKRDLLRRSWVNLTASSAEGWCLTVMEAASSGTPSAALAVGGLPESIEDGRTGVLADDPAELTGRSAASSSDRASSSGSAARPASARASSPGTALPPNARGDRGRAYEGAERPPCASRLRALDTAARGRPGRRADGEQLRRAGLHDRLRAFARGLRLRLAGCAGGGVHDPARARIRAPGHGAREVSAAAVSADADPAAGVRRWLWRLVTSRSAWRSSNIAARARRGSRRRRRA